MTLGGRGGQTSARVHMDGLMHVQPTDADVRFLYDENKRESVQPILSFC